MKNKKQAQRKYKKITPEIRLEYVKRFLKGEKAIDLGNELISKSYVIKKETKKYKKSLCRNPNAIIIYYWVKIYNKFGVKYFKSTNNKGTLKNGYTPVLMRKDRLDEATKEEAIEIAKIFKELYKEKTGRDIEKDVKKYVKDKKERSAIPIKITRLIYLLKYSNNDFYRNYIKSNRITSRHDLIDKEVTSIRFEYEFNDNLGYEKVWGMLKEKGFNFGVKEVRMSFKRLGYKSTRVIHYKRNDAKDTKKIVPNIIGGIYDCNTPFHFFSTDTSYLRTIDAPKDWSYMGGTIDMCTKFALGMFNI